jgi:hypothetical protein
MYKGRIIIRVESDYRYMIHRIASFIRYLEANTEGLRVTVEVIEDDDSAT